MTYEYAEKPLPMFHDRGFSAYIFSIDKRGEGPALYAAPLSGCSSPLILKSSIKIVLTKGHEVKNAVFAKKRGLTVMDMAKSAWAVQDAAELPRRHRGWGISVLKRALGLDRCTWSGWRGFKQYVWSSIVSYKLTILNMI